MNFLGDTYNVNFFWAYLLQNIKKVIQKIKFKNYKIFRSEQTLELKPITILIGKNNSGKSAIAKLPVLIGECLEGKPISWQYQIGNEDTNTVDLGSELKDLVYARNEITLLKLELYSTDLEKISYAINSQNGILEYIENEKTVDLSSHVFQGFLLDGKYMNGFDLNTDYIGAIRVEPDYTFSYNNKKTDYIGIKGQNAYNILIKDFLGDGTLINQVSKWYRENFDNWDLKVQEEKLSTGTIYHLSISSKALEINIKQTGQGIHQTLPLVVQSFLKTDKPKLTIIEEPETHLHPAAHGVLAQRFAESYLEDNNRNYLIETHSQNFVLRMRRLVAEKKLKPENLALYFVDYDIDKNESSLRKIEVDSTGEVEWWPIGIFEDTLDEVINYRKAQEQK